MSIIAIYKPIGITSHDVVDKVRQITGEQRVGHAGTLDPAAEGILVVGIGRTSTRQLGEYVQKTKVYRAKIHLGATSTTDDSEGKIHAVAVLNPPSQIDIEKALKKYLGTIQQAPSLYSAVKIRGIPAHRRLRRGEAVELQPRTVRIDAITLVSYTWPELVIEVTTGPGVYIRALARDLGKDLKTGGYLTGLIRTHVGQFDLNDAIQLPNLAEVLTARVGGDSQETSPDE